MLGKLSAKTQDTQGPASQPPHMLFPLTSEPFPPCTCLRNLDHTTHRPSRACHLFFLNDIYWNTAFI